MFFHVDAAIPAYIAATPSGLSAPHCFPFQVANSGHKLLHAISLSATDNSFQVASELSVLIGLPFLGRMICRDKCKGFGFN